MNRPNSTFTIDIAAINKQEHERYLREEAPKRSLSEWFGLFTPWVICLVFVAFYAQSAQHTSFVLDQLAPGVGWAAPIGVEAGLIYLAFRQRQLGKGQPAREMILRALLFAVAVLTNFAGALYDVTQQIALHDLSAGEIVGRLGTLPAPTQAALLMVVIMAFIVPIVCEVAGHGIADLVFAERRNAYREEHWKKAEVRITFQAVYNIYVQAGTPPHEAQALATMQVRGYFGKLDVAALLPEPANGNERLLMQGKRSANSPRTKGDRASVQAFANAHRDEIASLTVTQFQEMLNEAGIAAGRTLAYEIWKEIKA